jgi:hypothetical protein
MAATVLTEQTVVGAYAKEGQTQFTTLTLDAGDAANQNKIVMSSEKTLVIFRNADAANAEWATVFSSNDPYGRTGDITQQSIPASGWVGYFFSPPGWEQTLGGKDLLLDVESTDVKVAAMPA